MLLTTLSQKLSDEVMVRVCVPISSAVDWHSELWGPGIKSPAEDYGWDRFAFAEAAVSKPKFGPNTQTLSNKPGSLTLPDEFQSKSICSIDVYISELLQ